jgi:hypothetical protein
VIADAHDTMPIPLVREAQLLYRKVFDRYGDFATQIMSGFLFLRFLLPAFTVTKMVGMAELLPPFPRQALLSCSTMLMIAALKGTLEDKGKHMSDHFNDLAEKAFTRFNGMFTAILGRDTGDAKSEVAVNEAAVIDSLHAEIFPILEQVTHKMQSLDEANPVRLGMRRVLDKITAMGPRRKSRTARVATILTPKDAAKHDSIFNLKFPEDLLAQLADFVVQAEQPAPDGTSVLLVHFEKLAVVTDPAVVPFLILSGIRDHASSSLTVVYLLGEFDESKVPSPALIKGYTELQAATKKVKKVVIIEPCEAFAAFVARSPELLARAGHYFFPKDLAALTELAGGIAKLLPPTAFEFLTTPATVSHAPVNGREQQIRLHENSVQFVQKPETIQTYEVSAVSVILGHKIRRFDKERKIAGKVSFNLVTKDGVVYQIGLSKSSALCEGMIAIHKHSRALRALRHHVTIDTATLQWLMLNLGFINMVDDELPPLVRKSALDLVCAVFATGRFKHDRLVTKSSVQTLPENLLGLVFDLSADIARNNADAYLGFMTEFFKAYDCVADRCRATTLTFLKPWVAHWVADIDAHPEFIQTFLAKSRGPQAAAFRSNVWPDVAASPAAIARMMQAVLEGGDPADADFVTAIAVLDAKAVSSFWVRPFIEDASLFSAQILTALIGNRCFSNSLIGTVFYHLVKLRARFAPDLPPVLTALFQNVLHWLHKTGADIDFPAVGAAYENVAGIGKTRMWLDPLSFLAGAAQALVVSAERRRQLLEKFRPDLASTEFVTLANALVFGAAFAPADTFLNTAIEVATRGIPAEIAAVSHALALLEMGPAVASKLFFAGVAFSLFLGSADALPLVASAVRQLAREPNLCRSVPPAALELLRKATGLSLATDSVFCAFLIVAAYAEADDEATIAELLAGENPEPLSTVFGLVLGKEGSEKAREIDFGAKFEVVGAAVLKMLSVMPAPELIQYAIHLCARKPPVFAQGSLFDSEFGKNFALSVQDPVLVARLLDCGNAAPKPAKMRKTAVAKKAERPARPGVGAALMPLFSQVFGMTADRVRVTGEQLNEMLALLFK